MMARGSNTTNARLATASCALGILAYTGIGALLPGDTAHAPQVTNEAAAAEAGGRELTEPTGARPYSSSVSATDH